MTKYFVKIAISILLITQTISTVSSAQEVDDKQKEQSLIDDSVNIDLFTFSSDFPDSPALALSGIDVSKTTSVGELRKFAVSLPSTFNGKNNTALALDMSPAAIFFPVDESRETLVDYTKSSKLERLARRSKFSVVVRDGTEKNEDPDMSIKSLFAVGASTSFFDSSDPLWALADETQIPGRDGRKTVCIDVFQRQAASFIGQSVFSEDIRAIRSALVEIQNPLREIASAAYEGEAKTALDSAIRRVAEQRSAIETIRNGLSNSDKFPDLTKPAEFKQSMGTVAEQNRVVDDAKSLLDEANGLESDLDALVEFPKIPKVVLDAQEKCRDTVQHSLKMAKALDLGAAALWRGNASGFSDLESDGAAVWFSGKKGLWSRCKRGGYRADGEVCSGKEPYLLIGLTGRAGFDETVETGDEDLAEAKSDNWQAWTGIEYFSDRLRAAARIGYGDTEFSQFEAEQFSKSGEKWLLSADYRVTDTTWISVSYGEAAGSIDALQGDTLMVTLKFSEPTRLDIFGLN